MDLETENRIAALLMQEATKMRLQAEKEGVHVYLREPKVRGRPNSRFLTATVLGVQQANKAVEVNEMWRIRKKELELDAKLMDRSKDRSRDKSNWSHGDSSERSSSSRYEEAEMNAACTSSKRAGEDCYMDEDGSLRDEEIEEFLHSRVKRGRGAIGSRMDEPGPYLSAPSDSNGELLQNSDLRVREEWERRVLGPERPPFLKSHEPDFEALQAHYKGKVKKVDALRYEECNSKHRNKSRKDRSRDKKRKEKKSEKNKESKHRSRR